MKKLFSLAAIFTLMVMSSSCDKKELEGGETKAYEAQVTLVMPVTQESKADDTLYDEGIASEYTVNNAMTYFCFYDENRHRLAVVPGTDIVWQGPAEGQKGENITRTGKITLNVNRKPTYMLCFVNADASLASELSNKTLAQVLDFCAKNEHKGDKEDILTHFAKANQFFMSNSAYINKEGGIVRELQVADNVYEVGKKKDEQPVVVFVERGVAKTTVSISATPAAEGADYYPLSSQIKTPTGTDTHNFAIKFDAWSLNATNKRFGSVKKIETSYDFAWTWYNTNNGRSYWATDANYAGGTYPTNSTAWDTDNRSLLESLDLNYYSLNQTSNQFSKGENVYPEYCFENTYNAETAASAEMRMSATTMVLLKAHYRNADGTAYEGNIYRLDGMIYTEAQLKALFKSYIETALSETIDVADIQLIYSAASYKDRADVKATIKYVGSKTMPTGWDKDSLNKNLIGESILYIYRGGVCYYTAPIQHFGNLEVGVLGKYGVVRNHWYSVGVKGINSFGHPADPNKPIIPEDITEQHFAIDLEIKVLSWAKHSQDVNVGENGAWK